MTPASWRRAEVWLLQPFGTCLSRFARIGRVVRIARSAVSGPCLLDAGLLERRPAARGYGPCSKSKPSARRPRCIAGEAPHDAFHRRTVRPRRPQRRRPCSRPARRRRDGILLERIEQLVHRCETTGRILLQAAQNDSVYPARNGRRRRRRLGRSLHGDAIRGRF